MAWNEGNTATMSLREVAQPTRLDLERLFHQKFGDPAATGWAPRRRYQFGYFTPSDVYESLVSSLVVDGGSWLDVGGGHNVFPENPRLAEALVGRCSSMVAVDPSPNVEKNRFATERVQRLIEDYRTDHRFDLITLRMVVEHVDQPQAVAGAVANLLSAGGVVVVLTVNRLSPLTVLSRVVPFHLHHPIKAWIWETEEEDTFPVRYRMNSRAALANAFESAGLTELLFSKLDDLSTWSRHNVMNYVELTAWKTLRSLGVPYPENCLLGVYGKRGA
jgi:2-polyprenyl-3-methyl-5-hydroxy-6-metoxy-1,4-benzoquinol methylase